MKKDVSKEGDAIVGLGNMFDGLDHLRVLIEDCYEKSIPLKEHPFGLNPIVKQTILVACPGYAYDSYESMIAYIRYAVINGAKGSEPFKLRVINCLTEMEDKLNVYFEAQTNLGTFICGGCNNYRGAGREAKSVMDSVFALLSLVYNQEIETVNIPFPQSEEMENSLKEAYNRWQTNQV